MDCLDAQAAISEALDGATSDASALDAARTHCRECAECASFVRALTVVKRAGLPEPPEGLTDRVMAAVRAEAAAARARDAADTAEATAAGARDSAVPGSSDADQHDAVTGLPVDTDELAPVVIPISTRLKRTRPAVLAAWAGAAAVFLIGIGFVGAMGIRVMSTPPTTAVSGLQAESPAVNSAAIDQAQPPAAESTAKNASPTSAPSFITYNGTAYVLVGPSTVQPSTLSRLGSTRSSLDGGTPKDREVLGTSGTPAVYVQNDQGQLLEFKPVTRTYGGRTYQLKSGGIPSFGQWPGLPPEFAQPTAEDGSPTFIAVGADAGGLKIFRSASSTGTAGIAIAPGAPQGDPAAGNPNWSWWVPTP